MLSKPTLKRVLKSPWNHFISSLPQKKITRSANDCMEYSICMELFHIYVKINEVNAKHGKISKIIDF